MFFETDAYLVPGDYDNHHVDVYERAGGTTTLVSTGTFDAGDQFDSRYAGASTDGSHVFFLTAAGMTGDTDHKVDLFERTGDVTTAISEGPLTETVQPSDASYLGACDDGSRVFFMTADRLVAEDTDSFPDIYEHSADGTVLVTRGDFSQDPIFNATTPDGRHAVFWTTSALSAEDQDSARDLYEWSADGTVRLVSATPDGGNADIDVAFAALSAAGDRVLFQTSESLVTSDTDQAGDVYQWTPAGTTELTEGNAPENASLDFTVDDATRFFFTTREQLTPDDTDQSSDVYEYFAGSTTLATPGTTADDMVPLGGSNGVLYLSTAASLSASDNDTAFDIYAFSLPIPQVGQRPVISGSPLSGHLLSCSPGEWSGDPSLFTFTWLSDDGAASLGSGDTYRLRDADAGHRIRCRVEAAAGGGSSTAGSDPVSALLGGACANQVRGTESSDSLSGEFAGDRVRGRGGDDRLLGRGGSDCLYGGDGADYVRGGRGRDLLRGGVRSDRLIGGPGRDVVGAGGGDDHVRSRDGVRDVVRCGRGHDVVSADSLDTVATSCEVVKRR